MTEQPPTTNRLAGPATLVRRITLPSLALWSQGQAALLALGCKIEHVDDPAQILAELERTRERLKAAEAKRDELLQALSSANFERAAFRQQRDEAQQALAALLGRATP